MRPSAASEKCWLGHHRWIGAGLWWAMIRRLEAELKDVGDQAPMRELATAFPILRPGLLVAYCGRRPICRPQSVLTGIPLPCPASGCERAYAINLLARTRWCSSPDRSGCRRESGGRCCKLGHIGEHVASICRKDRQIQMSPFQWFCIFLPSLAHYRSCRE
jgi:hypothetical protein